LAFHFVLEMKFKECLDTFFTPNLFSSFPVRLSFSLKLIAGDSAQIVEIVVWRQDFVHGQ